jgi:phage-related tail protein
MERTISYEEHYVQVGFYQSIIKQKEKEVNSLKEQLKLSNDLLIKSKGVIETVKAKLEVSQQNRITL